MFLVYSQVKFSQFADKLPEVITLLCLPGGRNKGGIKEKERQSRSLWMNLSDDVAEARNNQIDLIAQLGGQVGQDASGLHARFALGDDADTGFK